MGLNPKPRFRKKISSQLTDPSKANQRIVNLIASIAAISALGQLAITGWQAWEAKKGGEKLETQIDRLVANSEQLAKLSGEANRANQNAMQLNAQIALKSLDAALQASRLDQRAWLSVPEYLKEGDDGRRRIGVYVANVGKTPALNVSSIILAGYSSGEPPEIVPQSGDWTRVGSIHPGKIPYALAIDAREGVAEAVIADYLHGRTRQNIRTLTCYQDVFGAVHWIRSCGGRAFNEQPGVYEHCKAGNDFGSDPEGKVCAGYRKQII